MQIDQILVTDMAVFCYLIMDEKTKEAALIDPAGDFDQIEERINFHNAKIKYVLNTHGHWDHVSGNDYMTETTGAKLLITKKDLKKIKNKEETDAASFKEIEGTPDKNIFFIEEGDIIKIGETEINVIETPGHSEGAVCFISNGNIFTGDTLFSEGYGRTDFEDGSEEELVHSISKKILTLPDNTVILPGHNYGAKSKSTVLEQKKMYGLI